MKPVQSASPYPWPDEEMMARYGMRYPTPEEQNLFPTHRLVLNVFKARIKRIARSPYLNPEAGTGWIVWAVESYPGSHQFRMLNGDLLHEQYHGIEWERVSDETAVTTPASAKRLQAIRQWQRNVRNHIRQNLRL
ncbi:MAG: hypothetical protein KC421_10850 [Anaerolineales bacterium]|nr:hypothetical protein [Anaerolineales bacterium]